MADRAIRGAVAITVGLLTLMGLWGAAAAQNVAFGKNKVQYRDFDWFYIQSDHFDIYYYEGGYDLALFSAAVLESSYVEVSRQLNHRLSKRVPAIIYQNHNDFQQTNVSPFLIEEGVGGFTESFKNRMVMPFTGSYEDFRHVLHHELTHAVTYDLLFGNVFGSIVSRRYMLNVPLWFAEGFAEYSSRHGWDSFADMIVRDAVIHGYLVPLEYLGGYLAYKEGQSVILYIAEKYGEEKIAEILHRSMTELSVQDGLKKAIGMNIKDLSEEWTRSLRKIYWPEISIREEPRDFAKYLTDHTKDGSFYNEKPVFSPTGNKLAIFTDRSDYTEIEIISSIDGEKIRRVVKGNRSADLESLHAFVSGMAWSPDGEKLVFVSKSKGTDALVTYSLTDNKIEKRWRFDLGILRSPAWSPDGGKIVFNGWKHGQSDLYSVDITTGKLDQLTDDRYDEQDPAFSHDGRYIAFSSDRPPVDGLLREPDTASVFEYGIYNIFLADRTTGRVTPLTDTTGLNQSPVFSPDSRSICFVSDRNGIYNLYVHELDSSIVYPVTNSISGCFNPTWSPDGESIAFSGFYRSGFDIFIMRDLQPKVAPGENLPLTALAQSWQEGESTPKFDFAVKKPKDEVNLDDLAEQEFTGYAFLPDAPPTQEVFDTTGAVVPDSTALAAADSLGAGGAGSIMIVSADSATARPVTPIPPAAGEPDTLYADVFTREDDKGPKIWNPGTGKFEADLRPPDEGPLPDTVNGVVQYHAKKYHLKFTPDIASGSTAWDPFFGLRGQMLIMLSDYMGDHQFLLYTDLINTIDQSNFQLLYFYTANRTNYGVGIFHSKYTYEYQTSYGNYRRFSDRTYGAQWLVARPFSKFTRAELDGYFVFIDRSYLDPNIFGNFDDDRSDRVMVGSLSLIHDTVIWGLTGPVNGRRYRVNFEYAPDGLSKGISYRAATVDYRQYWHLRKQYDFAFRLSGGISGGTNPKIFFLGGVSNWIGADVDNEAVYEVEGLYFSQLATPLRGYDYYEFGGTRYALLNLEFRYPFIDHFQMRFPLPMALSRVKGALFYDMGAAWFKGEEFKGATSAVGPTRLVDIKASFGFGVRANLGFLLLRFDTAWRTDLNTVAERPKYYFSLGGDF